MTDHRHDDRITGLDLEALYDLPAFNPAPEPADMPLAQGDVFVVPFQPAGQLRGRPVTTRVCLVRSRLLIPRHVLDNATAGVRWQRLTDRNGLIGLLTVPPGGLVQLRHLGGDHAPISIPAGTWQIRRQRAYQAPTARTRPAFRFIAD